MAEDAAAAGGEPSEEKDICTFIHSNTIYSFVILVPPLHAIKDGTCCTPQVWLAFWLFFVNLFLQMAITYGAAGSILWETAQFRQALLFNEDTLSTWALEATGKVGEAATYWFGDSGDEQAMGCCRGPVCVDSGMACCPPGVLPSTISPSFHPHAKVVTKHSFLGASAMLSSVKKPIGRARTKREVERVLTAQTSLCVLRDNDLDCSQPSFPFLNTWDALDANGDGIWTKEEAMEDMANVGCTLGKGITAEDLFRAVVRGLDRHFKVLGQRRKVTNTTIPHPLQNWEAVPRAYFEFWRGLAALCTAHDVNRCGGLIQAGIFDAALKSPGRAPREGIEDLDEAWDYCQRILRRNGICDYANPVSYIMFRQHAAEKCGKPVFSYGEVYTNPVNDKDVLGFVHLEYEEISKLKAATSGSFAFFQAIFLFLWYINLMHEFRSIIQLADVTWNFPADKREAGQRDEAAASIVRRLGDSRRTPKEEQIKIITFPWVHHILCGFMVFVRLVLLIYLAIVGTVFLLTIYSYTELLMNSLALAFVFQLPEFLYLWLIGEDEKALLASVAPLKYKTAIPRGRAWSILLSAYFWGLVVFPFICWGIVTWNNKTNMYPYYEALQCACYQEGNRCLAAPYLTPRWWSKHWDKVAFIHFTSP